VAYDPRNYDHRRELEEKASAFRAQRGLDEYTRLTGELMADLIPAHVFYPEDFHPEPGLATRIRKGKWDGFSFTCKEDGYLMVILNPGRPKTRQTATMMEEYAHHLLGHTPCSISTDPITGVPMRSFVRADEQEAYEFGSAILIPHCHLQEALSSSRSATDIATDYECSSGLVEFRIKRCGLWKLYKLPN
jgi:hypothetical protein